MLERAGLVQSLTVGVAPIVVVISSVCTFTFHMALGYDLTAAEVCTQGNCAHFMFLLRNHLHDKHECLCLLPHILPQAFTVVAVFNSMTFALKVTPLAVRSLSEGAVAIRRFQVRTEYTSARYKQKTCEHVWRIRIYPENAGLNWPWWTYEVLHLC